MIKQLTLQTTKKREMINITDEVKKIIKESGLEEGTCLLYVPHTTAGITVNEGADPAVTEDILDKLSELVPESPDYHHTEGNADAHIKSTIVGTSLTLLIKDAKLVLGTWQSVFFCEFDGPRERKVMVKLVNN
jgi:secondary thiamine-phosphate synthase enzyme